MKDYEILHSTDNFDVIDVNGSVGLKSKIRTISVMPYNVDEHGLIKEIGILREFNAFRQGNYAMTLITGTVETVDENLISTAARELLEEGGIKVPETEISRWIYLGNFYPYKDGDKIIPTFAVDVTDLEIKKPDGDGSEKENLSGFYMVPVNSAIVSDETLLLASFLRLFNYFYSKTIENAQPQGTPQN